MRTGSGRSSRIKTSKYLRQCLSLVLAVALMVFAVPVLPGMGWEIAYANLLTGNKVKPVVVVSGQGVLNGDVYSVANIVYEKSYTLNELKEIANADTKAATNNRYLYSAYNTYDSASIYVGEGVRLDTLLAKSDVNNENFSTKVISLVAPDSYSVKFDPSKTTIGDAGTGNTTHHLGVTRYYYPNLKANGAGNTENVVEVTSILAWAKGGSKGSTIVPESVADLEGQLVSMTGQMALNDYNNPLFNGDVTKILVGNPITATAIAIGGAAKTRSDILMMERADRIYTYASAEGDQTDYVRGLPLTVLLKNYDADDVVTFKTADDKPVGGFSITVGELISGNYMLAYEKGTGVADLQGIYETAQNNVSIYGCFTLYGDGVEPSKLVNSITVTELDFNIYGLKSGILLMDIGAIKGITQGSGGQVAKTYSWFGDHDADSATDKQANSDLVKGAYLVDLLASVGLTDSEAKVDIVTTDGFAEDNYKQITLSNIETKAYFVAYDKSTDAGATWTGFSDADTSSPVALSTVRIYRNYDDGSSTGYNRIINVKGITVTGAKSGETGNPGSVEIPGGYDLTIDGAGVSKTTYYTIAQLKNAAGIESANYNWLNSFGTTGSDTFEGVYLDKLLANMVGLTSSARSITVTAGDGFNRSFNLDSNQLGIYWTDPQGNKIMLAWKRNGSPCDLQLAVGQTDGKHVNRPMWVSNIKDITVNDYSITPGEGTQGSYEGLPKQKEEIPVKIDEVELKPTVIGDTATSSISVADITKALEEMKKTDNTRKSVVQFKVLSGVPAGQIKKAEVTLPADTINALLKEENVTANIKTDLGEIVLSPEVLSGLVSASTKPVVISITMSTESALGNTAKSQIGARPIVDITINQGDHEISSLAGNQIKVSISYESNTNESQNQLLVYYINNKGESTPVKLSRFDGENGQMRFGTVHLSLYAVGYNKISFEDIQNHWSKDNIEFLAARGILKGKAAGVFDPDGSVTRAEFVTMLANSMDGITVAGAKNAGFGDVLAGAWYANCVNWAVANGIISGYGDSRFGPNDKITREQMALMTDKFIKAMKADLDIVNDQRSFTDQAKINTWSAEAVSRMQKIGLINGNPDGNFAPQGTTTRAEAATVIKGYIEALIK